MYLNIIIVSTVFLCVVVLYVHLIAIIANMVQPQYMHTRKIEIVR